MSLKWDALITTNYFQEMTLEQAGCSRRGVRQVRIHNSNVKDKNGYHVCATLCWRYLLFFLFFQTCTNQTFEVSCLIKMRWSHESKKLCTHVWILNWQHLKAMLLLWRPSDRAVKVKATTPVLKRFLSLTIP